MSFIRRYWHLTFVGVCGAFALCLIVPFLTAALSPVERTEVPQVAPVAPAPVYGLPVPPVIVSNDVIATLIEKHKLVTHYAERVFFKNEATREWGTFCKAARGVLSVHHVTVNGIPAHGPKLTPALSLKASDFAFLTFDPETDPAALPAIRPGATYWIIGYPAGDTDGEVIRVRAYTDDMTPIGYWFAVEEQAPGIKPEGVLGGISGSCLVDEAGEVVAVVYANGFSKLDEGDTWALANPIQSALREAQGAVPSAALSFLPRQDVPQIAVGRHAIIDRGE